MSRAQDLHDKLKALTEEFKGTPGLAYHLSALDGILGHVKATIQQQAETPQVIDITSMSAAEKVTVPARVDEPTAAVGQIVPPEDPAVAEQMLKEIGLGVAPPAPPAKPAPAVQVAKPKPSVRLETM